MRHLQNPNTHAYKHTHIHPCCALQSHCRAVGVTRSLGFGSDINDHTAVMTAWHDRLLTWPPQPLTSLASCRQNMSHLACSATVAARSVPFQTQQNVTTCTKSQRLHIGVLWTLCNRESVAVGTTRRGCHLPKLAQGIAVSSKQRHVAAGMCGSQEPPHLTRVDVSQLRPCWNLLRHPSWLQYKIPAS
jgi:hypothetical protein